MRGVEPLTDGAPVKITTRRRAADAKVAAAEAAAPEGSAAPNGDAPPAADGHAKREAASRGRRAVNITDVCLRQPVFAWMMMAGTILFGIIAVTRIGVSQFPDVDNPTVSA